MIFAGLVIIIGLLWMLVNLGLLHSARRRDPRSLHQIGVDAKREREDRRRRRSALRLSRQERFRVEEAAFLERRRIREEKVKQFFKDAGIIK